MVMVLVMVFQGAVLVVCSSWCLAQADPLRSIRAHKVRRGQIDNIKYAQQQYCCSTFMLHPLVGIPRFLVAWSRQGRMKGALILK